MKGFYHCYGVRGKKLGTVTNSNCLDDQRFPQGLNKPLQLLQTLSQFVEITTYWSSFVKPCKLQGSGHSDSLHC